jgi:hypothetical protein
MKSVKLICGISSLVCSGLLEKSNLYHHFPIVSLVLKYLGSVLDRGTLLPTEFELGALSAAAMELLAGR